MCDSIRLEVHHLGVDVGSAHPTFFRTPMMDDVVADPAGRQLWGGNHKGLLKMVPIDTIINAIVAGIEKRAKRIVAPKSLALVAIAPGLFRPIVDRAFPRPGIVRAIELADATGWHDRRATERHGSPSTGTVAPNMTPQITAKP